MTVYVDELKTITPSGAQAKSHGNQWCHMMVGANDDLQELHNAALKIGLKRSYFQPMKRFPHYDLTPSKRALAVKHGAVEIHGREMAKTCKRIDNKVEIVQ